MAKRSKFPKNIFPPKAFNFTEAGEYFTQFQKAPFKIALQKKGELTNLGYGVIKKVFGCRNTSYRKDKPLFYSESDKLGIIFVRNNDLCKVVADGLVDAAIVGYDQVYEFGKDSNLMVIREFPEFGGWEVVLATPGYMGIKDSSDLKIVATEYPTITKDFFNSIGNKTIKIIHTHGSTEVFPLLSCKDNKIEAVVDIRVSGKTLQINGLKAWDPPLMKINPVLIANKKSMKSEAKKQVFEKFRGVDYEN